MSVKLTEEMLKALPDARGHFGAFGGRFVSETLMDSLMTLEKEYLRLKEDPEFQATFDNDLADYVGRPSPLYFAERLTREAGGAQIWLKREDLNHTGAHKVNNTIGQALLASFLGKKRIIAETGAGQHGVATATVCARLGLECHVFMGAEDVKRQSLNVYRMKLLGATVHAVQSGTKTLKDAMNDAMIIRQRMAACCIDVATTIEPRRHCSAVAGFCRVLDRRRHHSGTRAEGGE